MVKNKRLNLRLLVTILLIVVISQQMCPQAKSEADSLISKLKNIERGKDIAGERGSIKLDTSKVKLLSALTLLFHQTDPQRAIKYAVNQYNISKAIDYKWGMANSLENRGHIYDYRREYDKALPFFQQALLIHQQSGNKIGIVDVNNDIGVLYSKKGIYPEAYRYMLKAMGIAKLQNDIPGLVSSYNNIGLLYREQQKFGEALNHYFKCLSVQLNHKGNYAISYTYLNIAEIYRIRKQFDKGIKNAMLGLEAARKEDDSISIANNYSTLGNLYIDKGNLKQALECHEIALEIRENIDDSFGLFTSYMSYSLIYSKKANEAEALLYAKKALKLLRGNGELSMLADCFKRLSEIYASSGNYAAAYNSHLIYKKYSDSIFNSENERKLTEQKMNFEFNRLQEKSKKSAQEVLIRQKRIQNYTLCLSIAIGILIILLLIKRHNKKSHMKHKEYIQDMDLLHEEINIKSIETQSLKIENEDIQLKNDLIVTENEHEKREREKLQVQLDFNRRELASSTLYLFQKNQMLSELKKEIEGLKKGSISVENIDKIKAVIQQNLYLDADWEKFKLHFEQVHPDFFKDLNEKYPGLTAYEVRLYAYLHMKLSTKEIAGLLNITPASVTKAKVRLNKKINRSSDGLMESND